MSNDLVPKDFWKLSDYMQALNNVVSPNKVYPIHGPAYELDVIARIAMAKKAISNLEKFMNQK